MQNSTTFNVCKDNAKAALAFRDRLRALGFKAELLEPDPEHKALGAAVNADAGLPSAPAAVKHDAPHDVAVATSIEIESANEPHEAKKK